MWEALQEISERTGDSISVLIRRAVREYLEGEGVIEGLQPTSQKAKEALALVERLQEAKSEAEELLDSIAIDLEGKAAEGQNED